MSVPSIDRPTPIGASDTPATPRLAVFPGESEMARRCRALDWATTALGPVSGWSHSLRTIVATLLASRHPMFLFWGPEHIQLYNDAYRPSLGAGGRADRALGARGREFWPEIWEAIGPQIQQVLAGGPATWHEDQYLPIERNGRLDDVWWTYSYSPVPDDDGRVTGVLVVCQETTTRLRAEAATRAGVARQTFLMRLADVLRPLVEPAMILFEAARVVGEHLGASRVGYAEAEPDGAHLVVGRQYTDDVPAITGRYPSDDYGPALLTALQAGRTVVRPDIASDATLTDAERAAHAALALGATVHVPLVKDGRLVAVLFLHHRTARAWGADEVALLEAVAQRTWDAVERARAEAERERLLAAAETARRLADAARLDAERARAGLGFALASARLGAWELDLATGAMIASDQCRANFGLPPASAPGAPPLDYPDLLAAIHADDRPGMQAAVRTALETASPYAAEYRVTWPDGTEHWVAAHGCATYDGAGAPIHMSGVTQDVTEQRHAAAERDRLLQDTAAANRAKSEFLAVMSHELRTPLNAIGGYAELLELGIRGPVTPDQRADLARIQTSQRHLLGLINGVLNYARVEAGAVHYAIEDIGLDDVLATCEALVAPQVRAKGLTLRHDAPDRTLRVRGDREKVQQVVLNLLSNAIKFTEPGGHVTLSSGQSGGGASGGPTVRVTVTDTGIGIAPDQVARAFEPFVQVDARLTRTRDGTGLGLAISRDLARGMGGDLTAESTPGVGSRFTLTLSTAERPSAGG